MLADVYMSVLQAARALKVTTRTVQYWCDTGKLRNERVAKIRLVLKEDVARIISERAAS